ncbi:hypothetical protein M436DRAFT_65992 [Aureobasidium namibiae CBS 147.97]|uniref:Uncharacterized protein n=1 Tax=Aureobasidium namibiae CBS 147.97 TaxID=1043004 RepID=A0A074WG78_9PEZI
MSSSTLPPTPTPTSHSNKAIIGGVIGGTAFLILIPAAIFIPIFRKRRSCYDIALRRHTHSHIRKTTTIATSTRKDSMQEEKIAHHGDMEEQVQNKEMRIGEDMSRSEGPEMLALEEMVGLEEMLRIDFPDPARYELDGGSFVEGRANWEIKV